MSLNMRKLIALLSTLMLLALPSACGGGSDADGDGRVVVASYGGAFQKAQKEAFFTPFAKKSGVDVEDTEGTGFEPLSAMVKSGDVTWDVVSSESAPFANGVKADLY